MTQTLIDKLEAQKIGDVRLPKGYSITHPNDAHDEAIDKAIAIVRQHNDHQVSVITEWERDMKGTLASLERERAEKAELVGWLESAEACIEAAMHLLPGYNPNQYPGTVLKGIRAALAKAKPHRPVETRPHNVGTPAVAEKLATKSYGDA